MPPRNMGLLRAFAACRPMGLVLGSSIVVGVMFLTLGAVGMYAFTPSDMLQEYNDSVQSWKQTGRPMFDRQKFQVCSGRDDKRCAIMQKEDSSEGQAPAREFMAYSAFYYHTPGSGLFDHDVRFLCAQDCKIVALNLRHGVGGQLFSPQPPPLPLFAYRWSEKKKDECIKSLGLWWNGTEEREGSNSYCAEVFVLDQICVTVNRTGNGSWGVAPVTIDAQAGCKPSPLDLQGCGIPVAKWPVGSYTLVNGSAIAEAIISHTTAVPGIPSNPSNLPASSWSVNVSNVDVILRSVYDPYLTAESITNGTLFFDIDRRGTYALGGGLRGYPGMCLFLLGLCLTGIATSSVVVVSIFFPQARYKYLYKPVPTEVPVARYTRLSVRGYSAVLPDTPLPAAVPSSSYNVNAQSPLSDAPGRF